MSFTSGQIAAEYGFELVGSENQTVDNVGSLKRRNRTSLLWAKGVQNLKEISEGTVICHRTDFGKILPIGDVCYLITDSSQRLAFAQVVTKFFLSQQPDEFVNCVDDHRKNPKLRIAENVFIGEDVSIGDGTVIHPNVVIYRNTKIGKNCLIKTHVSLGTEGLGLEMEPNTKQYFKFPQIGGVILEDDVEIGPTSTVRRSALDDTVIGKGTKIGSLVNIGHNCEIGQNCILTCNIILSGSSTIGDSVFMGVNSIVKQLVKIGDNATVGQGAVVTKDVPEGEVWVGNPARLLRK